MKALLVFGSINLDLSLRVPRLPAPGETMIGAGLCVSPGGKGANQAHAARLFGARVTMAGAVGDDELARCALEVLERGGVDLSGVRRLRRMPTGVATINITGNGANTIVVAPGANARLRADYVSDALIDMHHMLLLQGEVPMAESMALARRFKARGGSVMLNLAPARELELVDPSCIDWLVVSQSELAALWAVLGLDDSPADARCVAEHWGCHVVVTMGAAGALACLATGQQFHVPALQTQVLDTTGASDTFCGALAAALTLGHGPYAALRRAGVAGSLTCRRLGAQAAQPTRYDIEQALLTL